MNNIDILEDLYLQYEDMEIAMQKYLELFNLEIVSKSNKELKGVTLWKKGCLQL